MGYLNYSTQFVYAVCTTVHNLFRLSVQLYGFELHTYNRSYLYKDLEEKFGLEPGIISGGEEKKHQDEEEVSKQSLIGQFEKRGLGLVNI